MAVVDFSQNVDEISHLCPFFRLSEMYFASGEKGTSLYLVREINFDLFRNISCLTLIPYKSDPDRPPNYLGYTEKSPSSFSAIFSPLSNKWAQKQECFPIKTTNIFVRVYNWQNILFKSRVHIFCIITFPHVIFTFTNNEQHQIREP